MGAPSAHLWEPHPQQPLRSCHLQQLPGPSQPFSPPGSSLTTPPCTCLTSVSWRPRICAEVGRARGWTPSPLRDSVPWSPEQPQSSSGCWPGSQRPYLCAHTQINPDSPPGAGAGEGEAAGASAFCLRLRLCPGRGPSGARDQNLEGECRGQTGECGCRPRSSRPSGSGGKGAFRGHPLLASAPSA